MADNITAPAAGAVLATDEISSVHYPKTKIVFGANGSATDVASDAPLPVAIISGGGGGDASAANQEEQTTLLTAIDAKLGAAVYYPATQPVSGTVGISGSVAVTGTFWQATQPVSIAGTVAVTGPLTDAQLRATAVPVSGPLTDTQLRASALPVSAASLPLPTGAGTSAKQDTIITALGTLATQTTLAAVLAKIIAAPATEAKQDALIALYTLPAGTDRSGSITTGGTAQQLAAANAARKSLTIQNISDADLWVNEIGGTAAADTSGSWKVPAGSVFSVSTNRAISIVGATTGKKFTATEI